VDAVMSSILDINQKMNDDIKTLRDGFNNFTAEFRKKEKVFLSAAEVGATTVTFSEGLIKFFRNWNRGKVTEDDVHLLNIPLTEDIPADRLKPLACKWNSTTRTMTVEMVGVIVSKDMELMEADPFTIYEEKGNSMCITKYTGSKLVVFDKQANASCRVQPTQKKDVYLEMKGNSCKRAKDHWTAGQCISKSDINHHEVIQMKEVGLGLYVFCNGHRIKVFGADLECPDNVFVLPSNASFELEGMTYKAEIGTHTAVITPELLTSWQHTINAHLVPGPNPYEIHTRSEEIDKEIEANRLIWKHQVVAYGSGVVGLVACVAGITGTFWLMKRNEKKKKTEAEEKKKKEKGIEDPVVITHRHQTHVEKVGVLESEILSDV
jgi:hypothetical protein